MRDQRIEPRAPLGLEDRRDGRRIGRIAAQAVDSFGAERHQASVAQQLRRPRQAVLVSSQNFSHTQPAIND